MLPFMAGGCALVNMVFWPKVGNVDGLMWLKVSRKDDMQNIDL